MVRHEQIEKEAYFLWTQRGCPFGSPEVDWCRAEKQLGLQDSAREAPMIVGTAKKVGSALGKVAGAVEAVAQR